MRAILFLSICLLLSSCQNQEVDKDPNNRLVEESEDNLVLVDSDNEGVQRGIETAQDSLMSFITLFEEKRDNPDYSFYVKKMFEEGEEIEHMWLLVSHIEGDVITGTLDNEPVYVTNVALHDTIEMTKNEVEDLMVYELFSIIMGGYIQY